MIALKDSRVTLMCIMQAMDFISIILFQRKLSDYQVSSSKSFKKDKHVAIQNYWSQLSIYISLILILDGMLVPQENKHYKFAMT